MDRFRMWAYTADHIMENWQLTEHALEELTSVAKELMDEEKLLIVDVTDGFVKLLYALLESFYIQHKDIEKIPVPLLALSIHCNHDLGYLRDYIEDTCDCDWSEDEQPAHKCKHECLRNLHDVLAKLYGFGDWSVNLFFTKTELIRSPIIMQVPAEKHNCW